MAPLPVRNAAPRQLLRRLLDEPNLVAAVRALPATALGKVIDHIGLEDAGEIVAMATTDQLRRMFDDDLWHSERPGKDETFDADRFALWLQIMLEAGETFAAQKLAELPEDLVTLALHKNVLVVNVEQMAMAMSASGSYDDDDALVEKALESCLCEELDEYRIISRKHEGWDAILSVLLALDRDHHDVLARVLDRLSFMTSAYAEEHGGLYEILNAQETLEADVAGEREERRSAEGYVVPSSAVAFLALARTTALDEIVRSNTADPLTRAYFRSWQRPQALADREEPCEVGRAESGTSHGILALLRDADVLPALPAAALLEAPAKNDEASPLMRAMRDLRTGAPDTYDRRMEELAYVTQVLMVGCTFEGRAMRPLEAAEATMASCSLGLERVREGRSAVEVLQDEGVDKLFRIGWKLLFEEVIRPAAHALVDRLRETGTTDEARRLASATKGGKPWTALPRLRAHVDDASMTALVALADECPSLRGELARADRRDGGFIATKADLSAVRGFLK